MFRSIIVGSTILAPFTIAGTVLIDTLHAPQTVAVAFIVTLGVLCGVVGVAVDLRLNPPASR